MSLVRGGRRRVVISDPFDTLLTERLEGTALGWATARFTGPFGRGALAVICHELRRRRQTCWPAAQLARRLDVVRSVALLAVSETRLVVFAIDPEFGAWRSRLGDQITSFRRDEIMAVRVRSSRRASTPVDLIFADHSRFRIYVHHPDRLLAGFGAAGVPLS